MRIDATSAGFASAIAEAIREVEQAWSADYLPTVERVYFAYEGDTEPYRLKSDGCGGFFLVIEEGL